MFLLAIGQMPFRNEQISFGEFQGHLVTVDMILSIIMLFTPGQGILSIVLGIFLMEFPGKQKLEYKMIQHDPTFNAINWLRSKAGKDALRR